jgi:hypothetical protein
MDDRIHKFDSESEILGLMGEHAYQFELDPGKPLADWNPENRWALAPIHHGKTAWPVTCRNCLRVMHWQTNVTVIKCKCGQLHGREIQTQSIKAQGKQCALCRHDHHLRACLSCTCPD